MLLALVESITASDPERPLLVGADRTLTYSEVFSRARRIAAALRARNVDRFGVAVEDPVDAILALIGSAGAGAEACVYPRGDRPSLMRLARELGHDVVVGDAVLTSGHRAEGEPELVALADLDADDPLPPPDADPVLILTSGTTGRPKGTRHRWSRLLAVTRPDDGAGRRWLLAYNTNQFAAVQVVVQALASGATIVVPTSVQPRHAVEAMREHRVTHASATPTFWRFAVHLLRESGTELLALEQITIGGEAVPESLLASIRERWPAAKVSQVYASSEFGSSVSVRDGRPGLPLSVLDRDSDAPVQLRIVDGELQARSTVGMLGYLGDDDRHDGWHATGDLVQVDGDRIRFVGRTSEVINVGGVKVYPLPVEEIVSGVPGVVAAVVFGRPNPVTGNVVAAEVAAEAGTDLDELKTRIRAATAQLGPAQRPKSIRFVDELDVRNHKLLRGSARPSAEATS